MNLVTYGFFLILIGVVVNCEDERPLISIEDGLIRGTFKKSFNGRTYMAFEGIPYAKPPIQKLRFRSPQPIDPWPGVLNATTTYTCTQYGYRGVMGNEDCLYLNVYVPREKIDPSEDKLDVIVHIHGGAFMLGNPTSMSGPVYLMDRDVVYVNFNYRLGPFGFLSAGDGTFHGNYGLKDQVAVLQWVQKNIDKFGGNKDSVTITGISAGGASVHLHYFSLMSKGLFHKGFAHSGAALNPWAVEMDGWSSAKTIIEEVGCFDPNIKITYRCMKQRSGLQIANAVKKLYVEAPFIPLAPFAPSTETHLPAAFLNAMPYLHLGSRVVYDVPFMISMTTEEGTLPAVLFYNRIEELNANWTYWLPLLLDYDEYQEEKKNEISAKIKDFYLKGEDVSKENFDTFVKICTHRLFHISAEKAAKMQANSTESEVYFIMMGYAGEKFEPLLYGDADVDLGVGHGSDGKFYYDSTAIGGKTLKDEREIEMKDLLLDMLVSFAKTGKPEIPDADFQPVPKSGNLKYLSIKGPDDIVMKTTKRLGAHEFWKSLELREDEHIYVIKDKMIEIK